jgi:hypothetical protein
MKPPKAVEKSAPSVVAWWKNPGVIYFVAAGEPPVAVKIGVAAITGSRTLRDTVVRRLSQIQSSNHELIRLLGIIHFKDGEYPTRDADVRERELHNEFRHLCRFEAYMRGAEWFSASQDLLNRIEQIATKPEALQLPNFFSSTRAREERA